MVLNDLKSYKLARILRMLHEELHNKGNGIFIEPTAEEKKAAIEKEMDKQRQIQLILRQRANDPPGLHKGDPMKHYAYEHIEALVVTGEMHDFEKVPKKSYNTRNTNFNQLDFRINHMMFVDDQFEVAEKYKDKIEFKCMKFHFHAVLGKREEEVWSLIKIVRVLNISKDVLFEGMLQNYGYHAVRANNVGFDFTL